MEIEDEVAAVEESIVKQESSGGRYVFPPVDLLQKEIQVLLVIPGII